jgi:hypothetical protein
MIDKDFKVVTQNTILLLKKTAYFSKHVNGLIKDFFDSASQFAPSLRTKPTLSAKELEELKNNDTAILKKEKMIDFNQINRILSILLTCYHSLVRKEKMHQFNRFPVVWFVVFY